MCNVTMQHLGSGSLLGNSYKMEILSCLPIKKKIQDGDTHFFFWVGGERGSLLRVIN